MESIPQKSCSKCRELKPLAEFKKLKTRYDSWCRSCYRADSKAYRQKHSQEHRDYQLKYRESHPLQNKEWITRNAKHVRHYNAAKRAKRRLLPHDLTECEWQHALEYFGYCCAVCGKPIGLWHTLAQDHWIAESNGGGFTKTNIVPLCHGVGGCNNSKHASDPIEWLHRKFGKREAKQIASRILAYFASLSIES